VKKLISISIIVVLLFSLFGNLSVFSYATNNYYDYDYADFDYTAGLIQSIQSRHNTDFMGIEPFQYLFPRTPSPMPSIGDVRALVILLRFPGQGVITEATIDAERHRFSQVSAHFYRESYGRLNMTFDIFYHAAERNIDEYFTSISLGAWNARNLLITEALSALESNGLDLSEFDSNGNGFIDALYIKVDNIATVNRFSTSNSHVAGFVGGHSFTSQISGIHSNRASWTSPMINTVPTVIHETGHLLGLPDHRPGVGWSVLPRWTNDIMIDSSAGNRHNIFHKYMLGWIEPVVIDSSNGYVLQDIKLYRQELQNPNGTQAVIIVPDGSQLPFTEFFILEYRAFSNGVWLWHVDATLNAAQTMFANPARWLQIVSANDDISSATNSRFSVNSVFSPYTNPSSNFHDGIYTGIFMQVLETTADYAIVRVGFPNRIPFAAEVKYCTTELTNQNVTATITFPEPIIFTNGGEHLTSTESSLVFTIEFEKNGGYIIEFTDLDGNIGQRLNVSVDWIDKEPPIVLNANFNIPPQAQMMMPGVVGVVNFSKPIIIINETDYLNLLPDGTGLFIHLTENTPAVIEIEFKDLVGNVGETFIIDQTLVTINHSTTNLTNQDVTSIIISNRDITVTNNDGNANYIFTQNGSFTFEFIDDRGIAGSITAIVSWIDKEPPTVIEIIYLPEYIKNLYRDLFGIEVTRGIRFSKPVIITSGEEYLTELIWGFHSEVWFYILCVEGPLREVEIGFIDLAGNVGKPLNITVGNGDISIHDDFTVLDFVIDDEYVNFRVINNVDGIRRLQFFVVEYIIDEYNNEQFIMATLHPIRLDGLNDFYNADIGIPETKNNVRFMLWEHNTMQPIIMPQNGGN